MLLNASETIERFDKDELQSISLECGYSVSIWGNVLCDEVKTGYVCSLCKDGTEILSFCVGQSETKEQESAELWESVCNYFVSQEGEEKTEWIRRNFLKLPADVPPWERRKAKRDIYTQDRKADFRKVNYSMNDDGNAVRFEEECSGHLIFDKTRGSWFAWITNHWEEAGERLGQAARFVASSILEEFERWNTEREREEGRKHENAEDRQRLKRIVSLTDRLIKHLDYSKGDRGMRAMLNICANSTMVTDLDKVSDVNLIAYKNGILDTQEGITYEIWESDRFKARYPTHYIDRTYTEGARPQNFINHLYAVFDDNTDTNIGDEERRARRAELCRYFMRFLGYILVAGNPEQIMVFLWGVGANGKSTTIDIIREVLGNEIQEAPSKELYRSADDKPATGINRALPFRAVLFPELTDDENDRPSAAKIDTDTVKSLTGEAQTAKFRGIYEAPKVQNIICTPIGVTNELPHFGNRLDSALLRRIATIPFPHKFAAAERDKSIKDRLSEEKDEIFSFIVDELKAYRNGNPKADDAKYRNAGLPPLPEFCRITQEELLAGQKYFEFITDTFKPTAGKTEEERTSKRLVEELYIEWCDKNGVDCSTVLKPAAGYSAENNGLMKERRLIRAELNGLTNAFRVMSIGEGRKEKGRYYCCIQKHDTTLKKDVS